MAWLRLTVGVTLASGARLLTSMNGRGFCFSGTNGIIQGRTSLFSLGCRIESFWMCFGIMLYVLKLEMVSGFLISVRLVMVTLHFLRLE